MKERCARYLQILKQEKHKGKWPSSCNAQHRHVVVGLERGRTLTLAMGKTFSMWSLWRLEDSPARDCSSTIYAKYSKDFWKHSGRKIDFSRGSVFAWVTRRPHVSSTIYDFWIKARGGGAPSRHGEPLMIVQLQNCSVIKSYWTKKNLSKYSLNYFGPWALRWETTHWYYSFSNIHFIE